MSSIDGYGSIASSGYVTIDGYESPEQEISKSHPITSPNTFMERKSFPRLLSKEDFPQFLKNKQLLLAQENFTAQGLFRIGIGHHSEVYRTSITVELDKKEQIESAVKVIGDANDEEFRNESIMLAEAQDIKNSCVVPLIGVYLPQTEIKNKWFSNNMLITKYMKNGDVENYLKNFDHKITHSLVLKWCKQLVEAAIFIKNLGIVHRDISARNCFLDCDMDLKLGDFGLARRSNVDGEVNEVIYRVTTPTRKLPTPLFSPEAFTESIFSHKSDIWAVGITFWEFFTRCKKTPYAGECYNLKEFLIDGKRLKRPSSMAHDIYKLCLECWQRERQHRPDGDELLEQICEILKNPSDYGVNMDDCINQNFDAEKLDELEESYEKGLLYNIQITGENLKICDITGSSDPYFRLKFDNNGNKRYKSSVIEKSLDPEWEPIIVQVVPCPYLEGKTVIVSDSRPRTVSATMFDISDLNAVIKMEIWDKDPKFNPDDFMGKLELPLNKFLLGGKHSLVKQSGDPVLVKNKPSFINIKSSKGPKLNETIGKRIESTNSTSIDENSIYSLKTFGSSYNHGLSGGNLNISGSKQSCGFSSIQIKTQVSLQNHESNFYIEKVDVGLCTKDNGNEFYLHGCYKQTEKYLEISDDITESGQWHVKKILKVDGAETDLSAFKFLIVRVMIKSDTDEKRRNPIVTVFPIFESSNIELLRQKSADPPEMGTVPTHISHSTQQLQ